LGLVVFLSVTFAIALPFYDVDLAIVPAFVPVVHAVVCITGLIAAAFLFSQYAVQPQPAFLVLASGYVSAGLFAFFQSLAFPDSYSATGWLGSDPSTAAWLFLLWRTTFPLGILAYALIRRPATTIAVDRPVALPIAITFVCVVTGACCLTWIMIIVEHNLPVLFADATHEAPYVHFVTIPAIALSVAAVMLLLARRPTTLDLWLIVTLITGLPDIVVPVSRYALGFYVARSYELVSSCVVLIALLTEASTLYARLASVKALQAHREAERLSSVEAATGAIAHELRQPLSAIRLHAGAGARLVHLPNPAATDLAEIMAAIEADVCRASDVIDRIRSTVRQQKLRLDVLDINTLISDVVKLVSEDATARRVEILTSLSGACPRVAGDRTQIIQVLLNLIANGMDAMAAVPPALRQLTLRTAEREGSVVITVSDVGCGISQEATPRLFEPFFTTRTEGTGLGLSIAHSIVVAHQGRMWAENNSKSGAAFYFSLPTRQSGQ
jgi:signal transduction histidine kinase